jgi:hypothetical protein
MEKIAMSDVMQQRATTVPGRQTEVFKYLISGLVVGSEVELPSAILTAGEQQISAVLIHAGAVPLHLESPRHSADCWEAADNLFLLRLRGVGNFLIREGREIIYACDSTCDSRKLALYLMGTCFAILMYQRGNLVLHASAIVSDGRAMLFCGPSGAGKSTLSALLCQRGYALLNDDICILRPAGNDTYEIYPDGRMLKLWTESMDKLQWRQKPEMAIHDNIQKYFCAPPLAEAENRPVEAIYILHDAMPPASIRRIPPLEGMLALKRNAYRPWLLAAMEKERNFFSASAALQQSAGVYLLSRPKDFSATDSLLDMLEEHWESLRASNRIR